MVRDENTYNNIDVTKPRRRPLPPTKPNTRPSPPPRQPTRDLSFYMGAVKSARHALDGKQVAAYFSLENCLRGLALLCDRLFGITLQRVRRLDYRDGR